MASAAQPKKKRPKVLLRWTGSAYEPATAFWQRVISEQTPIGAVEWQEFSPDDEVSDAERAAFFAQVGEAWKNLPDDLAARYPSPDHIRKRALVTTGHCDITDHVCESEHEIGMIQRFAARNEYAVLVRKDMVIRELVPKSMKKGGMTKKEFREAAEDVRRVLSELLGVDIETLRAHTEPA